MHGCTFASQQCMASRKQTLSIDGRRITVSNLDKVLYPGHRFTKANVIDYYVRVSKYLLPHLKDRPVTLKRFPNGVFGEFFYEKDAPAFTPDWVETCPVPRREKNGPNIRYILINDLATLVWLAMLANLEIHPFLYRAPHIDRPNWIVFDLDPGTGADILTCARVALILRDTLAAFELESSIKTSGSKGLQLYVPLNTRVTFEQTGAFANAIAELLAQQQPDLIVSQMPKVFRAKKVFIDWSQNADFKSTVSVYSLRAKTYKPFVSVPIEWSELQKALTKRDAEALYFEPDEALARLDERGDLFQNVLTKKQKLPREVVSRATKNAGMKLTPKTQFDSLAVRRSRQGGRKRFVVEQTRTQLVLELEMNDHLRCWNIGKTFPRNAAKGASATAREDKPIDYLTPRVVERAWDAGTYEVIEGSYESGSLRLHLSGNKLKGEWTLEKSQKDRWKIFKS